MTIGPLRLDLVAVGFKQAMTKGQTNYRQNFNTVIRNASMSHHPGDSLFHLLSERVQKVMLCIILGSYGTALCFPMHF
jgi:hypothetical protein